MALSWAAGPGGAAGQVVIEERVALTASDTSRTGPRKKNTSAEYPPFVYVWVRPWRAFTAGPFSSPNDEEVPSGAYADLSDPAVTVTGTHPDSSAFTLDLDRSGFMAAGTDSVAWDTGCAYGDQHLAVTRYDRAAESDTSKGSDPWALDSDWVALGAVQQAEVTAPFADGHWTGRADTTGLVTTYLDIGPITFHTTSPGLIDPSYQFYGTRKWTLYSFGRQKAFNYPFCTNDPVYATYVAIHVARPPVIRTDLSEFGFSKVVKQGAAPRPVRAFVTYPDGREGVPEITGETPVQVQLDGRAEELGDLQ